MTKATLRGRIILVSVGAFIVAAMLLAWRLSTAHTAWSAIAAIAALAVLVAAASVFIARRLTAGIHQIRDGADRFAEGDFTQRIPAPSFRELSDLAEAVNRMGLVLDERLRTVLAQRNELDAVLDSMLEGVIAVSSDARVLSVNRAAARLFGVDMHKVRGRSIEEAVRSVDVHACVRHALEHGESIEHEFTLMDQGERIVRVRGAALYDGRRNRGAVFVFDDVTRVRLLEQTRRDFVANVSHELRTPLTAIKGYAEMLLSDGEEDPAAARQFLTIILKQADRLAALVEDLLSLAALERAEESREASLEPVSLATCIEAALGACNPKAAAKSVRLFSALGPVPDIRGNAALIEQAFVNLIDNAIKYSEPESAVRIDLELTPTGIEAHVSDQGAGIPAEHLSRIFERFYRVDRARSRALGGTGLGLAIVKHIMSLHSGVVSVESAPGKGSVFTLHFPAPPPAQK